MTAIAGMIRSDGSVLLGADSFETGDDIGHISAMPKVFTIGLMSCGIPCIALGVAGNPRLRQAMQYGWVRSTGGPEGDARAYAVWFAQALRLFAIERQLCAVKDGVPYLDSRVLLGYAKHLFIIDSAFSVIESLDRYAAIGCGEELARGAIHALLSAGFTDPTWMLTRALEAAAHFDLHVRAPFHFVSA